MKWIVLVSLLLLFQAFAPSSYAQTIIQGNSTDDVSVSTNVQGSGSVRTHIESTVNGETKILDGDKPGTYTLHNDGSTQSARISPTPKPSTTPKPKITKTENTYNDMAQNILTAFQQFIHASIQNMLKAIHL